MTKENIFTSKPFLIGLACLLLPFDFVAFNIFLYPMQHVLSTPFFKLPWVLNAFFASFLFCSGLFFQPALYRRAKFLLVLGLCIYALAAVFVVGSPSFLFILLARLTQGIACALILPASLQLLNLKRPSNSYFAWGSLLLIGLFVSPWLSALILRKFALAWLFYFLGGYALLVALLNSFFLKVDLEKPSSLDSKGFLFISSSMACTIIGLSTGHTLGWGTSTVFFFVAFLLFNLAFFSEKKSAYPLFEFNLFKDRAFFSGFIALLFAQFILWPLMFFVPLYFQYFLGLPLLSMGLWLLTFTGAVVLGFILGHRGYKKGLVKITLSSSIFLMSASLFLLNFVGEKGHRSYLLVILGLLGAGWGILFLNIYSGGVGLFTQKLLKRGFSFTEIFPFLLGAIGLTVGFNLFLTQFNTVFYDKLGDASVIFPYNVNNHFFDILNSPHLHDEVVQNSFRSAFLSGFHSMTTVFSWLGFACLIFTLIFTPNRVKEVLFEAE